MAGVADNLCIVERTVTENYFMEMDRGLSHPAVIAGRLQRWALCLTGYQYDI